ncbi:MAG: DUF1192 domain-containing protein [Alphaproteobacteria bacterium]|nr:DUF1192 domain-containing protein [Alphaproteobacteria bacterium]
MNPDELEPQKAKVAPKNLEVMSVGDLRDYIAALTVEMARAEAMIQQKEAHRSGIEALFKK